MKIDVKLETTTRKFANIFCSGQASRMPIPPLFEDLAIEGAAPAESWFFSLDAEYNDIQVVSLHRASKLLALHF